MVTILKAKLKKVKSFLIGRDKYTDRFLFSFLASDKQDKEGDKAKNIKEKDAQGCKKLFRFTHRFSSFLDCFVLSYQNFQYLNRLD